MYSFTVFNLITLFLLPALVLCASRTSPPSGSIVVRQSGTESGEFSTISAAVASLSGTASASIFVYPGTYTEQVVVDYGGPLTIYGYTTDTGSYKNNEVTITHNLNAQDDGGNDDCATLRAESTYFNLYNINVANTYGSGKQATALSAHNSHQGYYGCSMTGYQDTLLANSGYQYYSNCYIEGAVDYIYGGASAWFGECTLASNGGGAITANSRDSTTDESYYVIDSSDVAAANTSLDLTEKVYLGRPWREYARVVFQRSSLSDIINPAGWTTLAVPAEPIFEEYDNTGDGSDTSQRVTETTLGSMIQLSTVIPDYGDWIDETY